MKVVRTAAELRRTLGTGRPDAFVPTLGALHDGHRSLLRAARASGQLVVGSIFVNPLQFGPYEDFAAYPRREEDDLDVFRAEGVDVAFVPTREEMYSSNHSTAVQVGRIGEVLEGAHRPGHFEGVATVCAKLFNLVDPRRAFFGQKDAQQVAVIKRMVVDLDFGVEIVVCPTVRDGDGLALSSRNVHLSREQRGDAVALYRSLVAGRSVLAAGGGPDEAESMMGSRLAGSPGVEADYAVALDPDTFAAPSPGGPVLLAVAAHVGPARLIDNILWIPDPPEVGPGRGKK